MKDILEKMIYATASCAMLVAVVFTLSSSGLAQNHNPEFKVSDMFLGGEPYIFIGDNDEEVYPHRTPVELKYRDKAPAGGRTGTTTLTWSSGGDKVYSYNFKPEDGENGDTGVIDSNGQGTGERDGGTDGKWTWTGDAEQQNYDGKMIYLQGKTSASSGQTATLKSWYSKDSNQTEDFAFQKDFTLLKVELTADPGKIHLGFDPPNLDPASGENDDPSVYWASVVQGGTNEIVNLNMSGVDFSKFEWIKHSGDGATVTHDETASGDSTDLTITATGSGNAIQEPEFHLVVKGSTQPLLTLNVMVLPQRSLPLAIYTMVDPNSAATQLNNAPPVADFVTVCNDVFKQAGVQFTPHNSSGQISFAYDTRQLTEGDFPSYVSEQESVDRAGDGLFTFKEYFALYHGAIEIGNHTELLAKNGMPGYVLFRRNARSYPPSDTEDPAPGPPYIRAGSDGWVGFDNLVTDLQLNDPNLQLKLAVAHEVAHLLTGREGGDDGSGHDFGPYPEGVKVDNPNGFAPQKPGATFAGTEHLEEPMSVLLGSGFAPLGGKLPWPYGRWMRYEEWRRANNQAAIMQQLISQ